MHYPDSREGLHRHQGLQRRLRILAVTVLELALILAALVVLDSHGVSTLAAIVAGAFVAAVTAWLLAWHVEWCGGCRTFTQQRNFDRLFDASPHRCETAVETPAPTTTF